MLAKRKKERGPQQQPGNHAKKRSRRRVNQQNRSSETSHKAGNHQWDQDAKRNVQFLRISIAARRSSNPQGKCVRRISRNRGNAREQECRKGYEASATGYGIDAASQGAGKEKKHGSLQVQAEVVSRFVDHPPVR